MTSIKKNIMAIVALMASIVFGFSYVAFGSIDSRDPVNTAQELRQVTFFSATTTSATSSTDATGSINIKGAKKVTLTFSRGDTTGQGNAGKSTFSIQASPDDGTTWTSLGRLLRATSTSQTAFLNSITLEGTSTVVASLDISSDAFYLLRAVVVETTDGEHTAKGTIEYGQ